MQTKVIAAELQVLSVVDSSGKLWGLAHTRAEAGRITAALNAEEDREEPCFVTPSTIRLRHRSAAGEPWRF